MAQNASPRYNSLIAHGTNRANTTGDLPMRSQVSILLIVCTLLFTCGSIALQRAIKIRQAAENERLRIVALYNSASADNLSAISAYFETRGQRR
jgi:hypothetical protein